MTQSNTHLIGFVESYEQVFREKASLKLREAGIDHEAKAVGFDAPTIKRVARARLKTAEQIEAEQKAKAEKEALFEIYCASLGMLDGTPLGDAARERLAKEFKESKPPKPDKKGKKPGGAAAGQQPDRDDDEPAPAPEAPKSIGPEEIAAARSAGADAHRGGVSILRNPYTAGDPRRASWDEGWCAEAGSDGMDIPAAYRRTKKQPDAPSEEQPPAPGADAPEGAPAR